MRRAHSLSAAAYALVNNTPGAVLLEGAANHNEKPWTRLFTAPLRICIAHQPHEMPGLFAEIENAVAAGLSAAGFFAYECGMAFEPSALMRPPRRDFPLAWFGIYERAYAFDHDRGEFITGAPGGLGAASAELDTLTREIARNGASVPQEFPAAEFALSAAEYARRIAAIREYIRAGDVYQLNFTAPLRVHAPGSAAALYELLRKRQPAAYGAFLHWRERHRILSFSPELFFRIDHAEGGTRRIVTRPMKGTAPRGRTTQEDRTAAEWLRGDAKNRSENLMIVDLVRNDLGRVARFGTVRAEELFAVERLPTLWQMTSTISAELRDETNMEDVFRALFPSGSITGAPKVRAMQLIGELEDEPRGVYTGAIGFFSPRQSIFNVAIRTLELDGEQGTMGVGSGIVIESNPAAEHRECLLKAEFLTQPAPPDADEFRLIESLLWENGYPLLDLHLDRLADSAAYFDFFCDRVEVKTALEQHARGFRDRAPRKVRLLLHANGGLEIADEPLAGGVRGALIAGRLTSEHPVRVGAAAERTDPADPMLFHKTTHRTVYAGAFADATRAGCDDVLFFNHRGELTEGAISNVFVEKDGRWLTPPVACGLLAGVYRRYLLKIRPDIEEGILHENDLRAADAIYICNAVRGLRKAVLVD